MQSDNHDDLLVAEARLGVEAEGFLSSDLGRYLLGRAELEERDALEELTRVDPDDAKAVRAAQGRLYLARAVPGWIRDAIQNGRVAYMQLETEETEHD
jgi:hypothetical protein